MSEAIALALPTDERRPWARAVAWLCLVGPFFFLSCSAAAVAAWLLSTGRAADVDAAIAEICPARPRIVLDTGARAAIAHAARRDA